MSKLAIVTGASSGIGNAFVRRLAADGYDLVAVGRRRDRLEDLASSLKDVKVQPLIADLSTGQDGADRVADMCNSLHLTMLVNSAGVPHYMPMTELPSEKACELVHVKVVAPTMLIRATVPGMVARGEGTIINVAGMIAFSGPAPQEQLPRRAVYAGTPAHLVAMTQVLHEELKAEGLRIQVLCPGVVATGFHERQGLDLSAVPRMSADDVVTASLKGLELGEVVCGPGVEDAGLLEAVSQADLAAFGAQAPSSPSDTGPAERTPRRGMPPIPGSAGTPHRACRAGDLRSVEGSAAARGARSASGGQRSAPVDSSVTRRDLWNSKSLVLASAERGHIRSNWRSSSSSMPRVTTCSRYWGTPTKYQPGSTPLKVDRSTGQ